jgi:hypothetical protein
MRPSRQHRHRRRQRSSDATTSVACCTSTTRPQRDTTAFLEPFRVGIACRQPTEDSDPPPPPTIGRHPPEVRAERAIPTRASERSHRTHRRDRPVRRRCKRSTSVPVRRPRPGRGHFAGRSPRPSDLTVHVENPKPAWRPAGRSSAGNPIVNRFVPVSCTETLSIGPGRRPSVRYHSEQTILGYSTRRAGIAAQPAQRVRPRKTHKVPLCGRRVESAVALLPRWVGRARSTHSTRPPSLGQPRRGTCRRAERSHL